MLSAERDALSLSSALTRVRWTREAQLLTAIAFCVSQTAPPVMAQTARQTTTLASAQSPAARDVSIETTDGGKLSATYHDAGRPGAAIIIFRNCDQTRASVDAFSRKLAIRGFHVIAYDYRSGNVPAGKTWRAWRTDDARDVFRWLAAQPRVDSDRVVAVGGSCGSTLALDFAASETRRMRGVVTLSIGPPDATLTTFLNNTPAVAIFGGESAIEHGQPNLDVLVKSSKNAASQLVVLPKGHGTELLRESAEFEAAVIDWIADRLVVRSGPSRAPGGGASQRPE